MRFCACADANGTLLGPFSIYVTCFVTIGAVVFLSRAATPFAGSDSIIAKSPSQTGKFRSRTVR